MNTLPYLHHLSRSNYGPDDLAYVDTQKIADAPAIDFLWTQWFGIGFYGPAVVPMLIAYIVTTVETIGDVTATHEVSGELENH